MQEQSPRTVHTQRPRRISVFDGQDLKKALLAGTAWLEEHREAINALNVFPVPDGDTGSNMSATMQAAIRGIAESNETSAGIIAAKLAHGALMGARGNSGVILSQTLRVGTHTGPGVVAVAVFQPEGDEAALIAPL